MASPLLLVENLFSTIQFSGHTVAWDETPAASHEEFRVADGRRSSLDYSTPVTANAQHTLTITCDRARAANCFFLDRGHNLAGLQIFIENSQDSVSWETVASPTIPTASSPGTLSNTNGIVTEEGAFGILFAAPPVQPGTAVYWRLRIPAMGAGGIPIIVGAWLGMAWVPLNNFEQPWGEDQATLSSMETVSEWQWRGRGPTALVRDGSLALKLITEDEYDLARYHIAGHFMRGRPMWVCEDQAQADRTFLSLKTPGHFGFNFAPRWFPRQAMGWQYVEHEPQRAQ